MNTTFPVFSTFLQPEVLAAASVTRIAFLEDSPVSNKPIVSSVIDISARARALAAADAAATAAAQAAASATQAATTEPVTAPTPALVVATDSTTLSTVATTPVTPTVTHINPPPTVVDPFADAATFATAQANSFATAQAVAAYYLMSGFGKDTSNVNPTISYLPPPTLVSPVNPVARIAALQLQLHA